MLLVFFAFGPKTIKKKKARRNEKLIRKCFYISFKRAAMLCLEEFVMITRRESEAEHEKKKEQKWKLDEEKNCFCLLQCASLF